MPPTPIPIHERFWRHVDIQGEKDCWPWDKPNSHGYGRFKADGRFAQAHRVAYELYYGPAPAHLQINHRCEYKACVNPLHLEPATSRENAQYSLHNHVNARKTHCPQGHEYTPENTKVDRRGWRWCRACRRNRTIRGRARVRAALA